MTEACGAMGDAAQRRDPVWWQARLTVVRGFGRILQTIDPAAGIPPTGILPSGADWRPNPHVYPDTRSSGAAVCQVARRGGFQSWTALCGQRPLLNIAKARTLVELV